ncbi:MAG TPA: hypothetical protein VJX67_23980 [Blastocatellia bacterium]|nr:hypothetical protein [Blastocatellia bacterium]
MKHLLWVVGLAVLIPAYILFEKYSEAAPNTGRGFLVESGICLLISLILLGSFFFITFRAEGNQEISITKF